MNSKLTDFIKYTFSQKEISLIIAKDQEELEGFVQILADKDFRQAIDTSELFKRIMHPSKVYFIIRKELHKSIYDFILQYPTGQVEIFNRDRMKSEMVSPVYKDVSVIFLVSKQTLSNIQKSGYQLLENTGMTYQS
jgi:hypothetical protein